MTTAPADEPSPGAPPSRSGQPRTRQPRRAAHRPSRRHKIIEVATRIFAREGYVAANVDGIARAAGVAPTAIYYHFGGKEELFAEALRTSMSEFSEHVFQVRPDSSPGTIDGLREVLRSGWQYWFDHPDAARLVARYSEGSTVQALRLRREWEDRHLERAYDYIPAARASRNARNAREMHAAHGLAIRLMLDLIIAAQASALDGGMGRVSRGALISAVEEMCVNLILSLR
jgi:AcrR family transcriptional regulator